MWIMPTIRAFLMLMTILGLARMSVATVPSKFTKQADAWFRSAEGRQIADNVLSWQSNNGSWPKNKDTASKPFSGEAKELKGTFDNSATTGELRFLATAFRCTEQTKYRDAFFKGLDLLLVAQYPSGGWPQRMPIARDYSRHITFNDGTMVRILEFLRDVAGSPDYNFVNAPRREAAKVAFDKGIECIIKCQIVVNGRPTVWCAQHDEINYQPRPARAYELVSLSGSESAGIVRLLISLDKPTPAVRQAVQAAVEWFESAKILGLRVDRQADDTVVVPDPKADPIWARFYEIETNRPFFCGRDGVKKYQLAEIEAERRSGYSWYGTWGRDLPRQFAKWKPN